MTVSSMSSPTSWDEADTENENWSFSLLQSQILEQDWSTGISARFQCCCLKQQINRLMARSLRSVYVVIDLLEFSHLHKGNLNAIEDIFHVVSLIMKRHL